MKSLCRLTVTLTILLLGSSILYSSINRVLAKDRIENSISIEAQENQSNHDRIGGDISGGDPPTGGG